MENMKNLTDWKLRFRSLMIEVTRMCNLRCSHCMRGEPQDLNITREILKNTFQQIDFIETLHLTGGEPFLYPELIEMLVDVIIETNLRVHRISTVDNGTILGEDGRRCVEALNRAGRYIHDSVWSEKIRTKAEEQGVKPVHISISNSKYHVNDIEATVTFYQSHADVDLLKVSDQGEWDTNLTDKDGKILKHKDLKHGNAWLKLEGRAAELDQLGMRYNTNVYQIEVYPYKAEDTEDNVAMILTGIQVCANGNVYLLEPMSFDNCDRNRLGNILEADLLEMIIAWNWDTIPKQYMLLYEENKTKLHNPKIPRDKAYILEIKNGIIDTYGFIRKGLHEFFPLFTRAEFEKYARLLTAYAVLDDCKKASIEEKEHLVKIICDDDSVTLDTLCDIIDEMQEDHYRRESTELGFWDSLGLKAYRNMELPKRWADQAKRPREDKFKADQR